MDHMFVLQEIIITKHPSEKLGMGIKGGVGGQSGNPFDKEDEGIFISWVSEKFINVHKS